MNTNTGIFALGLLWLGGLVGGFGVLMYHSNTPGTAATTVATWPKGSHMTAQAGQPTLLMFLHPKCACSRASANELERLMTTLVGRVNLKVIFFKPEDQQESWIDGYARDVVRRIEGQESIIDNGGREAAIFGVSTSGQVLLYDINGQLVFRGGITPSRGHMGDSLGRDAILAYLNQQKPIGPAMAQSSVFGCSIRKISSLEGIE